MSELKNNLHKATDPKVWVEGNDGTTYICSKSDVTDPKNATDSELERCLDESQNPQNN